MPRGSTEKFGQSLRYRQPKALAPIPKGSSVLTNPWTEFLNEESFECFQISTVLDSSDRGCDCNGKEAEKAKAYYFSSGDVIFLFVPSTPRHQALALYYRASSSK